MNFMRTFFLVFFLLVFSLANVFSQGCSDAGFCTMGAMRPNQSYNKSSKIALRSIEISEYIGFNRFGDSYYSTSIDANVGINPKTSVQFKLPYTFVFGHFANLSGLGDISLSATRNVWSTEKQQINATFGMKLPTGNADVKDNTGKDLPMYYQTTLGTYDIVLGASWITRGWMLAVGYQQPLNQIHNGFKWGLWNGDPDSTNIKKYPVSNQLIRGNDVMIRIERNFRFSRFNGYIGLLPIYRLTKDKIISPQTGQLVSADGSDGLAMTLLFGGGYRLSYNSGIKVLLGFALVERKINPDGLSRTQVFTVGYEYRF